MPEADFDFAVAQEFRGYMWSIRDALVSLFGITEDEALGRMNRFWQGQKFVDQLDFDVTTHETPEDWARFIYYEVGVRWWLAGEDLRVRPYP